MEIIVVVVSFIAALLTFFSGFGLGTLLLPVFAIWFPPHISVGMTALVHLSSNLFKFVLMRKFIDKGLILRFGGFALIGALIGAQCLVWLSDVSDTSWQIELWGLSSSTSPVNVFIGVIILCFLVLELIKKEQLKTFTQGKIKSGGLLTGFFGGLSGHQGMLRSLFLINTGISKEAFIATGTAIAVLVDISRIGMYTPSIMLNMDEQQLKLIAMGTFAAFSGALIGKKLLTKVTIEWLHYLVSAFIFIAALMLILGLG